MTSTPLAKWLPTYVLLASVWGSSYLFIALALESFTPAGVAICRMALGSAVLLVICAIRRTPLPPRTLWPRLAIAALLATVIPWNLWALAQTYIPSTLAAIIASSIPLLTLLLMVGFFRDELPTRDRVIGLLIGFFGILVVIGVWQSMGAATWIGIVAALAGNVAFATSLPYARRHLTGGPRASTISPLSLATGMLIFSTLETAPFALMSGITEGPLVTTAVGGIVVLGCVGSGFAYLLNYSLIRLTDTTTASTVLYAMPVVGVVSGILFLGEKITWNEPVGGAVVLMGAALAQGLLRLPQGRRVGRE